MKGLMLEIVLGLVGLFSAYGILWGIKRSAKKRGAEETERKAKEADYEKAYEIRKRNNARRLRKPDASSDNRGNRD